MAGGFRDDMTTLGEESAGERGFMCLAVIYAGSVLCLSFPRSSLTPTFINLFSFANSVLSFCFPLTYFSFASLSYLDLLFHLHFFSYVFSILDIYTSAKLQDFLTCVSNITSLYNLIQKLSV